MFRLCNNILQNYYSLIKIVQDFKGKVNRKAQIYTGVHKSGQLLATDTYTHKTRRYDQPVFRLLITFRRVNSSRSFSSRAFWMLTVSSW